MPTYNLGTARGRVDIDTKGLKDADLSLREAGRGLLFTGGALVAGFGYVVKTAADFEKQLDFVQAITNATVSEMDALADKAIELGKRGPFGPNELAGAFVELAKAGVETEDILAGVAEASVSLAAAGDLGLVESTEILVNTLKTFNLSAEESVRVVDQIAGAANASTIDVDDFAFSLRYAGSIAAAVGVPLEDVATALAILGDRGIKGSTGGTSLRRVLLNLQPASQKAADTLAELGIITEDGTNKFFTAEGQAKSLAEVFQILNEATRDLDDAARLKAFNTIFGARAAPSALILAGQGVEGFEAYADAINRTEAADVAAKRLDNLAGAVTRLNAAIEATFIQSGTPFQAFLTDLVQAVTALVVAFSELPEGLQTFILGSVAALGVMALLSGAFLLTVGNIIRAIRVFGELGLAFRTIATLTYGLSKALGVLSVALLTNPVFLIIAAIIALGVAFYIAWQRSEAFRNFIKGLGEDIMNIWGAVADFFSGPFVNAIETGYNKVKGFFGDIGDFFSGVGSSIGNALSGVGDAIGGALSSVGDVGGGALDSVGGFFSSLAGIDPGSVFDSLISGVSEFASGLPARLAETGKIAVDQFIGFIEELPGRLGYALGFALGRVTRWGVILVTKVYEIGGNILSAIASWGVGIIYSVGSWIGRTIEQVIGWGLTLVYQVGQIALKVLFAIGILVTQLPGLIGAALRAALDWIIGLIPVFAQTGFDLSLQFVEGVLSFIRNLPQNILTLMTEAYNFIFNTVPQFIAAAFEIGEGVFSGIIDTITDIPGAILGIINDAIGMFKNAVGRAKQAAKDFGAGIWNGFKDGMGISSPSYIEEALFAIEDQMDQTARQLNTGIRAINAGATRLPTITTGESAYQLAGLGTGTIAARRSGAVETNAGSIWNQNAPLIGEATIRSDQDIIDLARELERNQDRKKRAVGDRSPSNA